MAQQAGDGAMGTTRHFNNLLETLPLECPNCHGKVLTFSGTRKELMNGDIYLDKREPYMRPEWDKCWGNTDGKDFEIPSYPQVVRTRLVDDTYDFFNLTCLTCGKKFVEQRSELPA